MPWPGKSLPQGTCGRISWPYTSIEIPGISPAPLPIQCPARTLQTGIVCNINYDFDFGEEDPLLPLIPPKPVYSILDEMFKMFMRWLLHIPPLNPTVTIKLSVPLDYFGPSAPPGSDITIISLQTWVCDRAQVNAEYGKKSLSEDRAMPTLIVSENS